MMRYAGGACLAAAVLAGCAASMPPPMASGGDATVLRQGDGYIVRRDGYELEWRRGRPFVLHRPGEPGRDAVSVEAQTAAALARVLLDFLEPPAVPLSRPPSKDEEEAADALRRMGYLVR
ncbi:MAG: hypothetical protein HY078_00325 [Elusimicrobia bacterium]|nr:hypothetical protein [Elusimicrobiota bacterium]